MDKVQKPIINEYYISSITLQYYRYDSLLGPSFATFKHLLVFVMTSFYCNVTVFMRLNVRDYFREFLNYTEALRVFKSCK
jgi:hypothetical protein